MNLESHVTCPEVWNSELFHSILLSVILFSVFQKRKAEQIPGIQLLTVSGRGSMLKSSRSVFLCWTKLW